MNFFKKVLFIVLVVGLIPALTVGASVLFPYQGGTGIGSVTAGDVGKFLAVSSTNPFAYKLVAVSGGGSTTSTLQDVTTNGNTTTNQIQFAGGTSTAAFRVQGVFTAPTGSFTYTDATTTNATFATVGTLTGSNATITNVSSTNMSVSSSLLVAGKAVCLADGTNCLPTTTPTLQQVATAGNTTSLALQFAGGTSTAAFTVQGLLTATTASTTGNASVGGAFGLTGAATFGSTLAVTGVSTLATTTITALSVSGNTTGTTAYYTGLTVAGTSDLQGAVFIGTSGATVNGGVTAVGVTTTNLFATTARFSSLSLVNPLPLTSGGTNASLTASNGGIFYSTATAGAILAGTATANQVLLSGASTAPSWSSATYPSATTINQLLYSSSANTITGLTTANNGVLITSAGGVPSIGSTLPSAVQGNITSLGTLSSLTVSGGLTSLATTTISSLTLTNPLPLTSGGTNASLTASNGGIFYSTASAGAILAGTATANKVLMSGASGAPSWSVPTYPNASATAGKIIRSDGTNYAASTATYPDTTTINQILYSSAANTISGITTANSGVLVTNGSGVPSIATDIPTAVTIGSSYIYRVGGTDVSVADGGSGASSFTANGVLLGNGTSAFQVTATGTSGQVLTSNGGGSAPTFQSLPAATYASTTFSGSVSISSTSYLDTGISLTLPSAGTYRVGASVRGFILLNSGSSPNITARFYNSTDSSAIADSDTLVVLAGTTGLPYISTAWMERRITVTASKTIKLQAKTEGGTTFSARDIQGDGAGWTTMFYEKVY